ncbi:hypothetical protein KL930_004226 [Ogataea haglerorum]|nr:hypothetical protein KL932_003898 [Ogataea haglerorum]KAG7773713.1 hypothetical protein KL930_004226 [Ogataea haglerorum]KAG7776463.1 hypothetical protein KL922_003539 [Ogataea haglerorum]
MSKTKIVEASVALSVPKNNETRKSALSARPWPSESDWERDVLELKLNPKIRGRQRLLPESHEVLQAMQRNYTVRPRSAAQMPKPRRAPGSPWFTGRGVDRENPDNTAEHSVIAPGHAVYGDRVAEHRNQQSTVHTKQFTDNALETHMGQTSHTEPV